MHHDHLEGSFRATENRRSKEVAHGVKGEFRGAEHSDAMDIEGDRDVEAFGLEEGWTGVVQGLSSYGVEDEVDRRKFGKLFAEGGRRVVENLFGVLVKSF